MKKVLSLIAALTLCLAFTGCAASDNEATVPVTLPTEVAVETTAETQIQETEAETESLPVTKMPADAYFKNPNIHVGYQNGDKCLRYTTVGCIRWKTESPDSKWTTRL